MIRIWEGFQKGVNLGGWISQFAVYDPGHFETFITEQDAADIAALGFDHVRVPVDYNVLQTEDGRLLDSGFGYLENCRRWCEARGLRMLIDLHECYGYSFDPLKKDMDRRRFFFDKALQDRFLALWTALAERFGPYPEQVAFEPLNEVVLPDVAEAWNGVVRRFIETVRPLAAETWLVIGGVNYNHVTSVPALDPPYDHRVVYNFHCYEPLIFTHQGAYWMDVMPRDFRTGYPESVETYRRLTREILAADWSPLFDPDLKQMGPEFFERIFAPALETAEKRGVPLYCGEYGVIDLADNASKLRWLRDIHAVFKKHGIGHALWNYKEKDFGLVDQRFASIRDAFIEIV